MYQTSRKPNLWKGALAGLMAGAVASFVMEQFQNGLSAATSKLSDSNDSEDQQPPDSADDDPTTVKAAAAVSENVLGHRLTESEKPVAGSAMHYAFGSGVGLLFGVLAEYQPRAASGLGMPFGAAVWLVADEVGVPAAGLSGSPFEHPPSSHAYSLASHLVYGAAADVVRRGLRSVM